MIVEGQRVGEIIVLSARNVKGEMFLSFFVHYVGRNAYLCIRFRL
jgi:hypothetical protein